MAIVEKVSAEVRLNLPDVKKAGSPYSTRTAPTDHISLKEWEDFAFNVRMRGGSDDTDIFFEHKSCYNGYSHEDRLSAFKVNATATMDGFPVLPPVEEKVKAGLNKVIKPEVAAAISFFFVLLCVFVGKLIF